MALNCAKTWGSGSWKRKKQSVQLGSTVNSKLRRWQTREFTSLNFSSYRTVFTSKLIQALFGACQEDKQRKMGKWKSFTSLWIQESMKKEKEQVRKHSHRQISSIRWDRAAVKCCTFCIHYLFVAQRIQVSCNYFLPALILVESCCSEVRIFGNMQRSQQASAEFREAAQTYQHGEVMKLKIPHTNRGSSTQ